MMDDLLSSWLREKSTILWPNDMKTKGLKIKRWYHYVLEFFGIKTGPWYRFTYRDISSEEASKIKVRMIGKDASIT